MEAVVVCKKGVRAHPDDPAPKVLLARVYAEQGKDRKALEELGAVLAAFPTFVAANRLPATLHFRLGEKEPGEAALRRAAEAAPDDPEVRALLSKHGVIAPPQAQVERSPPAPAAPGAPIAGGPPVAPRVAPGGAQQGAPERSEDVPLPTPVPSQRAPDVAYAEALAEKYATQKYQLPGEKGGAKRSHRGMLFGTIGLAAALALTLGGWALYSMARKERIEAIDRLLKDVRVQVERDTYPAYQQAAKGAAEILEKDADSLAGHAFLAYIDALRWAEHGEGDSAKREAVHHVDQGLRLRRPPPPRYRPPRLH